MGMGDVADGVGRHDAVDPGTGARGAAPARSAGPEVVAKGPVVVVDVEEVVENYNRAKDVRKELETRRAQVDAEMQKRKDAITAIETMLKSGQLTEGSAEYNKQVNEQAVHGLEHLVFRGARQKVDGGIERVELEEITMRAAGRAGTLIRCCAR